MPPSDQRDETASGHASPHAKLLQSSMFLMASAGLTAAIGFVFWALVARSYTTAQVGLATSLLSAISLISYLSLFGFNATLIRYPARGNARNSQVTWTLAAVSGTGLVLGIAYLAFLSLISPQLEFIRRQPVGALAFVGFCVMAAVNLLTDSVFIGARMPQYNTLVDGVIQSLAKLAMPVFLVALGAVGILAATGAGYVVAVIASIAFMRRRLKFRFDLTTRGTRLRATARYSLTSYVSALLNLLPLLVLPSIVLRTLGPDSEAYYFMAFQIATLLSAASYAISESLFSEGAHDPSNIAALLRRSAKIMLMIVVPGALIVATASGLILDIFGAKYAAHAHGLLVLLSLGSIAVAFNSWASCALRVLVRMRALVISNVVLTVAVLGFAGAFGSRGLLWIGYAWVIGNFLSGLTAAVRIPRHAFSLRESVATAAITAAAEAAGPTDFMERPTEPLFFPWNRPDAISFGNRPHSRRHLEQASTGPEGREAAPGLGLHLGDMRIRPRAAAPAERFAWEKGPAPAAGRQGSEQTEASP